MFIQLFDNEEEGEEDGAAADIDLQRKGKCIVIKTSTRQVLIPNISNPKPSFLPVH